MTRPLDLTRPVRCDRCGNPCTRTHGQQKIWTACRPGWQNARSAARAARRPPGTRRRPAGELQPVTGSDGRTVLRVKPGTRPPGPKMKKMIAQMRENPTPPPPPPAPSAAGPRAAPLRGGIGRYPERDTPLGLGEALPALIAEVPLPAGGPWG